ncbi:glycosyltransferase [Shewanella sp. UCD-KL12]|uniref:glycosyltransferase n=1 Tax=Shewanella sp. UCD-KL12 TaxID=1917163 RepID=UPI000970A12B|nr:glycosyltransferase [Shewanella sp. UCD-KL12]
MFSIIIPAYNESKVIIPTLESILFDEFICNSEILVVTNACYDNTVEVVENYKIDNRSRLETREVVLTIIDTPVASKTNAINLGIEHSSYQARVLLDADILISGKDLHTLHSKMLQNNALVASPKVAFNYQRSNFWVSHYYRVASQSNYNRFLRISNVIALSSEAIARLGKLPKIIADDDYIRRQFIQSEKLVVDECQFEFVCPLNVTSLLKALTRVKIGNLQLAKIAYLKDQSSVPLINHGDSNKPGLLSLTIFSSIKLIVLLRAKWQLITGNIPVWERDESSRT